MTDVTPTTARTARLAWAVLATAVITIVSGDIVQATESGAGCGDHWPRCDGSLFPGIEDAATAIEFTHRLLTAALTLLVIWFVVSVFRSEARGALMRRLMGWLGFFLALEVTIGALLVAFGWVEDDASVGRVIADGLHVVNTFFLIGAAALAVFVLRHGPVRALFRRRNPDRLLVVGAVAILIVAVSGAVNSLADTLFPADSVVEGLRAEFGGTAPFLVRMRVVHPVLAVALGSTVFLVVRNLPAVTAAAQRWANIVMAIVGAQFVAGVLNIALLTPLETQVIHLLLAEGLWIMYLFLSFEMLRGTPVHTVKRPSPTGGVAA